MFIGPFSSSILKRAREKKLLDIHCINIRDYGVGKHRTVDDTPYGGGVGMLLRVDVVVAALEHARCKKRGCKERVILLDAGGKTFIQQYANDLTFFDHLIFICGHYEGFDARIFDFVDETISIGDYILTGGEIPAMVVVDTLARLLPGVLGKNESAKDESFQLQSSDTSFLEYPQYTKPALYKKRAVPRVLLSGHHKNIATWRKQESKKRTIANRPDLLKKDASP